MDETHAATAATFRAARRRSPWLVPGGLLLILALLTFDVVTDGPLVGLDQRIRAVVQARAHSATWRWVGGGGHAPAGCSPSSATTRSPFRCSPWRAHRGHPAPHRCARCSPP